MQARSLEGAYMLRRMLAESRTRSRRFPRHTLILMVLALAAFVRFYILNQQPKPPPKREPPVKSGIQQPGVIDVTPLPEPPVKREGASP
jgi:hypothetical protein